jgi:Mrp family chromosome partitioning ATPase
MAPSGDICYFEAVKSAIEADRPDVVILSAYLHAAKDRDMEILNAVYAARDNNVRVIFLAGSLDVQKDAQLLRSIAALGVYDIIFNPCPLSKIMERVKTPAGFSEASMFLKPLPASLEPEKLHPRPAILSRLWKGTEGADVPEPPKSGFLDEVSRLPPAPAILAERRVLTVAVCSPVPAGKTFVAVNLAAVAAACGERAVLFDLDFEERAVYSWLNISSHPAAVYNLLSGKPETPASRFGAAVYGADPLYAPASGVLTRPSLLEMLSLVEGGFVVMDMPRLLTDWHSEIAKDSAAVVVVADPDCHRYWKLAAHASAFGTEPLLVANKHVRLSGPLDFADLFKVQPEVFVPLSAAVYDSALIGRPLALSNRDIFKTFEALLKKIKQRSCCHVVADHCAEKSDCSLPAGG